MRVAAGLTSALARDNAGHADERERFSPVAAKDLRGMQERSLEMRERTTTPLFLRFYSNRRVARAHEEADSGTSGSGSAFGRNFQTLPSPEEINCDPDSN